MIRIVSGKFKGRHLLDNKFSHIRPTTDKVRQALFTKLQFFIEDKNVLDLFCGTGAVSIEAYSRGAKCVEMVDIDFRSVKMAQQNLNALGIEQKVHKCDATLYLQKCQKQFDLIFLDPPYKSGLYEKVLNLIYEKNLLTDEGILVCEHAKEDEITTSKFKMIDEKKYGNIVLTYFAKN